jgi:hypothetical protein
VIKPILFLLALASGAAHAGAAPDQWTAVSLTGAIKGDFCQPPRFVENLFSSGIYVRPVQITVRVSVRAGGGVGDVAWVESNATHHDAIVAAAIAAARTCTVVATAQPRTFDATYSWGRP